MNMIKKIFGLLLVFTSVAILYSCTKLKEKILDESSPAGLTEKQIAEGTIAPVYSSLPGLFQHTNYFALQQISTDEAILPFRGGTDWNDNGIYISLHRHTTPASDVNVLNTWNLLSGSLARAVLAINALATNTDPSATLFLAEARGMRAYYNLVMLDMYGLCFKKELPTDQSKVLRGEEAIDYI